MATYVWAFPTKQTNLLPGSGNTDAVTYAQLTAASGPGGANTQLQFNNGNGGFGGSANLTFDSATNTLTVGGNITTTGAAGNISGVNYYLGNAVTTTGNIQGSYILGNGAFLTGISGGAGNYGNANVIALLPTLTSNVTTIANVQAGYFIGDGSQLTNVATPATDWAHVPQDLVPVGNVTQSLGNATNQWLDLWVSNTTIYLNSVPLSLTSNNTLLVNNIPVVTSSNTSAPVTANISTTANVVAGNIVVSNAVPGSGITFADGTTQISAYGNADVAIYMPTYTGNLNNVASVVAPSISNGSNGVSINGNLITTGNATLTIDANSGGAPGSGVVIIPGNLRVLGSTTTVSSNTVAVGNLAYTAAANAVVPTDATGAGLEVGPVGNSFASITYNPAGNSWVSSLPMTIVGGANVSGPLTGATTVAATGNISTGGNVIASNYTYPNGVSIINTYANSNAASYLSSGTAIGNIITSANVQGQYFIGNGQFLTGIVAGTNYSNANVANYLPLFSGNLNNVNTITAPTIRNSATGAVLSANILTTTNPILYVDANSAGSPGTGLVIIPGNLEVRGTTTTVNSNVISIGNLAYTAAANATSPTQASGAGLTVGPTGNTFASITYSSTSNTWVSSLPMTMLGGANVAGPVTGATTVNATGNITTGGNVVATNYTYPNGVSIINTYANSNVSSYLAVGNNAANIVTTANVSGGYILGNGAFLTGIVTSGNGAGNYSNANVAAYLPTYTGNLNNVNVVAAQVINTGGANGAVLSGNTLTTANPTLTLDANSGGAPGSGVVIIPGNLQVVGTTTTVNSNVIAIGNLAYTAAANATTPAQASGAGLSVGPAGNTFASITYNPAANTWVSTLPLQTTGGANVDGPLTGATTIAATGDIATNSNVIASNFTYPNGVSIVNTYGNANVSDFLASNTAGANIITTANISGGYVLGNGRFLSGITAGTNYTNANVAAYLPGYNGPILASSVTSDLGFAVGSTGITIAANVITTENSTLTLDANSGGAPGTGIVVIPGNLQVQGTTTTVTSNTIAIGNLAYTAAANATSPTQATGAGLQVGPVGNTYASITYNAAGNNWVSTLPITVQGGANLAGPVTGATSVTSSGNITAGGNINTTGNVVATNYTYPNGQSIINTYSNANVTAYLPVNTANVSAPYFFGNAAFLSGIPSGYSNAAVAAYLPTYTGNLNNVNTVTAQRINTGANGAVMFGNLVTTANPVLTIDANSGGAPGTGIVVIPGNLQVQGTTTTVNSNVIAIGNLTYTAAANANTASQASGAGVTVGPEGNSYASITYNSAGNTWVSSLPIQATGGANVDGPLTGASTIDATGNVSTTGSVVATDFTYANGVSIVNLYNNSNVAAYLAGGTDAANIITTANISGQYILGNGAFLTGITGGNGTGNYGNSNVAAYLPTYTGTLNNVASVIAPSISTSATGAVLSANLVTTANAVLTIDANSGGAPGTGRVVIPGNLQVQGTLTAVNSNVIAIGNLTYTAAANAANSSQASGAGVTVGPVGNSFASFTYDGTGNTWVSTLPMVVQGGANIAGPITGATTVNATGNITSVGSVVASNFTYANGTSIINTYGNANVSDYFASGISGANITTAANISGQYFVGNGRFLTGITGSGGNGSVTQIPAVYFSAAIAGNNQTFGNSVLASYLSASAMTVFRNGTLLENNKYTLSGDVLTVNVLLAAGDNIDVITTSAGNVNTIISGYGNSNVSTYLGAGVANSVIPSATSTYTLGSASKTWSQVNADQVNLGTGNLVLANNSITSTSSTITLDPSNDGSSGGNVIILANLQVTGNLTYANAESASTANLVWQAASNANTASLASGGGLAVGPEGAGNSYATFTYNSSGNAWVSNLPVAAPAFAGDGSLLSNVTGANVTGVVPSANTAVTATNLQGGVAGNIVYQTGTNTTGFLAPGASGTILASNGPGQAPSWITNASGPAAAARAYTLFVTGNTTFADLLSNAGITDSDGKMYTILNETTTQYSVTFNNTVNGNMFGKGGFDNGNYNSAILRPRTAVNVQTYTANDTYVYMSFTGSNMTGATGVITSQGGILPDSGDIVLNFVAADDPNGWMNSDGNHRFQPTIPGWYFVTVQVSGYNTNIGSSSSVVRYNLQIRKNSNQQNIAFGRAYGNDDRAVSSTTMSGIVYLNGQGDYVDTSVFNDSVVQMYLKTSLTCNTFSAYLIN